jgi:hypothetical protein
MMVPSGYGSCPSREALIATSLPRMARKSLRLPSSWATEISLQSRYPAGILTPKIGAAFHRPVQMRGPCRRPPRPALQLQPARKHSVSCSRLVDRHESAVSRRRPQPRHRFGPTQTSKRMIGTPGQQNQSEGLRRSRPLTLASPSVWGRQLAATSTQAPGLSKRRDGIRKPTCKSSGPSGSFFHVPSGVMQRDRSEQRPCRKAAPGSKPTRSDAGRYDRQWPIAALSGRVRNGVARMGL